MRFTEESPEGWRGTVRAMMTHHPEKFDKAACKDGYKGDKMCPYAIAHSMAKKGAEPHYKNQPSSLEGEPKKKKGETVSENKTRWQTWLEAKEATVKESAGCNCQCEPCKGGNCKGCSCENCSCEGCGCC